MTDLILPTAIIVYWAVFFVVISYADALSPPKRLAAALLWPVILPIFWFVLGVVGILAAVDWVRRK